MFDELVVGYDAGLLEPIHALAYLHVDPSACVHKTVQLVLGDDFFWNDA